MRAKCVSGHVRQKTFISRVCTIKLVLKMHILDFTEGEEANF